MSYLPLSQCQPSVPSLSPGTLLISLPSAEALGSPSCSAAPRKPNFSLANSLRSYKVENKSLSRNLRPLSSVCALPVCQPIPVAFTDPKFLPVHMYMQSGFYTVCGWWLEGPKILWIARVVHSENLTQAPGKPLDWLKNSTTLSWPHSA